MTLGFGTNQAGLAPGRRSQGDTEYSPYSPGLFPQTEELTPTQALLLPSTLLWQPEFKSTNVIFWGRRGKGKTLSMIGLSKMVAPGFHRAKWRLQANIPVDFSDIGVKVNCHPLLGSFIAADMDTALRSHVLFDELTEIVPSRRSMSKANINSMSVMVQIRKLMCEVASSTQFPTDIDQQMLKQLDLYILCDAHIPKDARWNPYSASRAYIKLFVFDLWGQFTGDLTAGRYFPPPLHTAMRVMYLRNLPAFWNNYQTRFRVVSEHASEDTRARLLERHWDLDKVAATEEEMEAAVYAQQLEDNPAMREFDETVEARFAEYRASDLPPPAPVNINVNPQNLEEWMAMHRTGGRFKVTGAILPELRRFGQEVAKMDDVYRLLEAHGFDMDHNGKEHYAQAR